MNEDSKVSKETFLQALDNLRRRELDKKARNLNAPDRSVNLAKGDLDKDVLTVKGDPASADVSKEVQKVKTGEEFSSNINDKRLANAQKQYSQAIEMGDSKAMERARNKIMELTQDIKKKFDVIPDFPSAAKKGLKQIPIVGGLMGLAAAATSGDASAAIPILDMADPTGPERGSLDARLEAGTITPEERMELQRRALERMRAQGGMP